MGALGKCEGQHRLSPILQIARHGLDHSRIISLTIHSVDSNPKGISGLSAHPTFFGFFYFFYFLRGSFRFFFAPFFRVVTSEEGGVDIKLS